MPGSSQKRRASTSAANAKNAAQARISIARHSCLMVESTFRAGYGNTWHSNPAKVAPPTNTRQQALPIDKLSHSRYAARLLGAHPELAAEIADPAPFTRDEMARALAGSAGDDEPALKARLRRLRQRVLLRVMARDLAGGADAAEPLSARLSAHLAEVCAAMSDLAELEIGAALEWTGEKDLVVIGMGKLGGRELNVSS